MNRRPRNTSRAFGVFNPRGQLLTSRDNREDAEFAARILVGTNWQSHGYSVDPITVTRETAAPSTHPEMIDERNR